MFVYSYLCLCVCVYLNTCWLVYLSVCMYLILLVIVCICISVCALKSLFVCWLYLCLFVFVFIFVSLSVCVFVLYLCFRQSKFAVLFISVIAKPIYYVLTGKRMWNKTDKKTNQHEIWRGEQKKKNTYLSIWTRIFYLVLWKPLIVITLGPRKTDYINPMITITNLFYSNLL